MCSVASRLGKLCRSQGAMGLEDSCLLVSNVDARVGDLFTLSMNRTDESQWESGLEGENDLTPMAVGVLPVTVSVSAIRQQSTAEISIQVPKWDCGVSTLPPFLVQAPFSMLPAAVCQPQPLTISCKCHVTHHPLHLNPVQGVRQKLRDSATRYRSLDR